VYLPQPEVQIEHPDITVYYDSQPLRIYEQYKDGVHLVSDGV
jgi:hypothetical protein